MLCKPWEMAFCADVLCGNVYIPRVHDSMLEVSVNSYSPGCGKRPWHFVQRCLCKIALPTQQEVSVLHIGSVGFFDTHLKTVIVVIKVGCCKVSIYSCQGNFSDCSLTHLTDYELETSSELCGNNVCATHGPCVMLTETGKVHVIIAVDGKRALFDLNKWFNGTVTISRILQFTCLGERDEENMTYFLAVLLCDRNTAELRVSAFCFNCNSDKGFDDNVDSISIDLLFVPDYQKVISSLHVVFHSSVAFEKAAEPHCFSKESVRANSTVICTEKHCLLFHKGCLKYSLAVPISSINCIRILNPTVPVQKWDFFLQSDVKGVCWLKVNENEKLECSQLWDDARYVLLGDFRKRSTKQALLLHDITVENWQSNILMVQISPPCHGPLQLPSKLTGASNELLKTALTGLQQKVLAENAAATEMQRKIAEKTAHMIELVKKIKHPEDSPPVPRDENWLLDIILHKDESQQNSKAVPFIYKDNSLTVVDQWKLPLNNFLVFGWTLKNTSDSCITKVDGLLVADWITSEYAVKTFLHDSSSSGLIHPRRNHIVPGELVSVVFGPEIPVLTKDKFQLSCIISWCTGVTTEPASQPITNNGIVLPDQQIPLHISFSASDVYQTEQTGCTDMQELMSFRTFQEVLLLEITAKITDLASFENILLKQRPPYAVKVKQHQDLKWFVFRDKNCPFYGVNMTWFQADALTIEAFSHFKNTKEAVLFVRWLYDILPLDVIIIPAECTKEEVAELPRRLLSAMKNETDLLQALMSHQNVRPSDATTDVPCDSDEGTTREVPNRQSICVKREEFNRVREMLTKREQLTDEIVCKMFRALNSSFT